MKVEDADGDVNSKDGLTYVNRHLVTNDESGMFVLIRVKSMLLLLPLLLLMLLLMCSNE